MVPFLAAALLAAASPATPLFWQHWSDGKAELNGYDLVQPRYGELRHGRAVLIYVTEPFSRTKRVKADRPGPDTFNALKLNVVRRFQTGVYDYGLMTSVFVEPDAGFAPVKVAFSAQEWCGTTYEELRFDPGRASMELRSYFEGETGAASVPLADDVLAEDALLIQLRQLASEKLAGGAAERRLIPSATYRRLLHKPFALSPTTIAWSGPLEVKVPAGAFQAMEATYTRADGVACTVQVESPYPHRVVGWRCADGEKAALTGSTRLAYWQTQREGDEKLLKQLGLDAPDLTP
jgi:hypothetical protein